MSLEQGNRVKYFVTTKYYDIIIYREGCYMKEENLQNIRKKYKELGKTKQHILDVIEEKSKLEQLPEVKKYLSLLEEIESYSSYSFSRDLKDSTNEQLLDRAVRSEKITETNKIFICMGTYRESSITDIEHGASDYLVPKDDPSADYRVYSDIEKNSLEATFEIPISQCNDFEQNNIVLHPTGLLASSYYNEIRKLFFETSIKYGQEKAIEKILYKRNLQKR